MEKYRQDLMYDIKTQPDVIDYLESKLLFPPPITRPVLFGL